MTSIDQAPNTQPNNEPRNNTAYVHPERVDSTLGGNTPAHPDYEPPTPTRGETEALKGRTKYIVSGAAVMSVLVATGAFLIGAKSGNESSSKPVENLGDDSNSAFSNDTLSAPGVDLDANTATLEASPSVDYESIDVSTLTVDQFYDDTVYPETYRVRWAHKELRNRQTPELIKGFLDILENDKRLPMPQLVDIDFENPKPIEPSLDNNGDEILWMQSLDTYTASLEPDPNVGRKLLAGTVGEENPGFYEAQSQMDSNKEPVTATYRISRSDTSLPGRETGVFYETVVGNYTPNGVPSKFLQIKNTYDNSYSEIIVNYVENQWVTVDIIALDSGDWIMHPEELILK